VYDIVPSTSRRDAKVHSHYDIITAHEIVYLYPND
jgi:hypothetical protein